MAPSIHPRLVSIGCIDDTGYFCNFGDGRCEITKWTGEVIGCIPKTGGLYRTLHAPPTANAAHKLPHMSLHELHDRYGHIAADALLDLVALSA